MSLRLGSVASACLLSAAALSGCVATPPVAAPAAPVAAPAPSYPAEVNALVARTKAQVTLIKMADLKAALDNKSTGVLVDVREEDEFEDGFVPGAVNAPRGLLEFRIWKLAGFPNALDRNTKITLYCASGGRAALATKTLQDLGFTNVTMVDMKFDDWAKAGHPVAKPK